VQANIIIALGARLRGTGCRPYGSDMSVKSHDLSVRYPDVTVDCGTPADTDRDIRPNAPRVIFEVLSPATRQLDLQVKKAEYRTIDSVDTIVFVDPEVETIATSHRHGDDWIDTPATPADLMLPSLDVVIPHAEMFARD
jgi:Uma2 family endonuclease